MPLAKPLYATSSTLTVTGLSTLADTASVSETAEHDNTVDRYMWVDFSITLTAAAATTGTVDVYALEGNATGALSSTAKTSNMRRIGSVELNGTTAVTKVLQYDEPASFWKLHFINNSGAALASETVTMRGVNPESI